MNVINRDAAEIQRAERGDQACNEVTHGINGLRKGKGECLGGQLAKRPRDRYSTQTCSAFSDLESAQSLASDPGG